jgi:hypothetical protein
MLDLEALFKNFFADREHSLVELSRYANKHLIYLTANNPGNALDGVITEVSAAFATFAACLGDEESLAAAREAANQARNNLRKSMTGPNGAVSRASAAVAGAYGRPSADYTACFPLGVEGIAKASLVQREERLENLRKALVERGANPAIAPHVTTITALKTQWSSLKTAAGLALGAESTTVALRKAGRVALTKALTRSALWLAWHFNDQPKKFAVYCPVHLLKNPQAQAPGTCTIEVTGGAGAISGTGHASGAETIEWSSRAAGSSGAFALLGSNVPDEAVTFDGLAAGSYEVQAHGKNDEGSGPESDVVTVTVT